MTEKYEKVHDKAGALRHWRGFDCRCAKKKTRINKGKEKSTKKRQNTLIRCPGSVFTAQRIVTTQAEREHGPFCLSL